ncbi:ABC transporter ATP-binding protein [Paracoccus xiamenensis]|uniref:ABC transporter ATP-binding protein n=1 Tax=Paracoccus xiamenensis TaxID=2714901 RepID=UPI00140D92AD|nr:sn-glycerol-3-phosphate ABC transporter ATP-binding protein UgpC [Paracoccus xiamenensis]NHF74464.1 sn-glycerol-3-phosphate ABC transporter ATP-binding protein UgpC [Paracoccus xiamenensis]
MSNLHITSLDKDYSGHQVLHGINLNVDSGEFVVFVGPSGCGKSTLLRTIAGLEDASGGSINIDARDVTRVDPAERGIAMVFQTYALYPHMTVEENMAFGLEMSGMSKAERKQTVAQVAETLHLSDYLPRKPRQLSGGQRQRVAIGRAIVRNPKIFLFDEPLSNLDAELRVKMRMEISALHQRLGATMIYVTHDQVEAMTLADKIVVLRDGRIEQVGAPMDLYADPDNAFVAGFIGSPKINFLQAQVTGRSADGGALVTVPRLGLKNLEVKPRGGMVDIGATVTLGLRPEHFGAPGQGRGPAVTLIADAVENLGSVSYAHAGPDAEEPVVVEVKDQATLAPGGAVTAEVLSGRAFLFDADGRRL